jgi:trigger factor
LPITQQHAQIEESDIDEMITKLREQRKTWEPVERSSQTGDRVTIDFSGHIDGETFTDGTVENYSVELGSGQMMTGFEDNLVDLNIGDSKSFTLSFPHDHANEKLAGKPATFDLSVKLIESPIIPEISPEFIRSLGLEDETDDAFRSSVKENMARELKNKLKQNLRDRVFDAVYQKLTIALPQSLVQRRN